MTLRFVRRHVLRRYRCDEEIGGFVTAGAGSVGGVGLVREVVPDHVAGPLHEDAQSTFGESGAEQSLVGECGGPSPGDSDVQHEPPTEESQNGENAGE